MQVLLDYKNVSLFQNDREVVSNLSIEIKKGEFVYLLGKTGSGKSTFLKSIYADVPINNGNASVCGYNLGKIKSNEIPFLRRKLGIIFQDFQLLNDRNVYENLKFVMNATGWTDETKIKTRAIDVLQKVNLQGFENKKTHQLSGGEQQRVSIARALINNPELILADEPTGNLDPESSEEILNVFKKINEAETSVIFATHDMLVYNKFKSRTLIFENNLVTEKA
ncbi:MAG: ATP-binding cassette domain-containing protein [Bacteroidetes bacterium]|nr:ATP-binding cassette domain-containing protein [Bacteroidota bacterium]